MYSRPVESLYIKIYVYIKVKTGARWGWLRLVSKCPSAEMTSRVIPHPSCLRPESWKHWKVSCRWRGFPLVSDSAANRGFANMATMFKEYNWKKWFLNSCKHYLLGTWSFLVVQRLSFKTSQRKYMIPRPLSLWVHQLAPGSILSQMGNLGMSLPKRVFLYKWGWFGIPPFLAKPFWASYRALMRLTTSVASSPLPTAMWRAFILSCFEAATAIESSLVERRNYWLYVWSFKCYRL